MPYKCVQVGWRSAANRITELGVRVEDSQCLMKEMESNAIKVPNGINPDILKPLPAKVSIKIYNSL